MYIAIDGDNVGSEIERLIVLCRAQELIDYWGKVSNIIAGLKARLISDGAQVIICGGDTILAQMDEKLSAELLYGIFLPRTLISFSVGTGDTMLEAHIALKTAKASGKNCWIDYKDLTSIHRL